MGLELLGIAQEKWGPWLHDYVCSQGEIARRNAARERVRLYRDDYKTLLCDMLRQIFREPAVYQRVEPLVQMIGGSSFLKRIADELGRPLYAIAPFRRVIRVGEKRPDTKAQEALNALYGEMQVNACMDAVARLLTVSNTVLLFVRYVENVGMHLDVLTPDMRSVIAHPEIPTRPLAVAYVKRWHDDKPHSWIVWDDKRYLTLGPRGGVSDVTPHDFGRLPFVEVRHRAATSEYEDVTRGEDLVSQTKQSMFLDLIGVKKIKQQSHIQLTYSGDLDNLVKDQVSDEESVLVAQGTGAGFGSINLESDPGRYQLYKAANEAAVAANYGISRDRLNQATREATDDVALQERVAELAAVLDPAEADLFRLVRAVSREHPEYRGAIPDDAELLFDRGQVHNRVDRKTQLDVRQTERSMGLRSGVDDVLEDNPEFGGDRERAMAYIDEKMQEEALLVEKRRALNAPAGGTTPEEPGQDPAMNGAMGPAVRDGEMTRDEAAAMAERGPAPYSE